MLACPSVVLGVVLTFLIHSLWNYQRICLRQLCVLLTLLRSLVQLVVSSVQIFCEKVVKEFEGLDNVTIHVRDEGLSFLPALSISQDSRSISLGEGKGHAHLLECSSRYPRAGQVLGDVCSFLYVPGPHVSSEFIAALSPLPSATTKAPSNRMLVHSPSSVRESRLIPEVLASSPPPYVLLSSPSCCSSVLSLRKTGNETHARRHGGCCHHARFCTRHCPTQATA